VGDHRWRQGCQPYAPATFYLQANSWYSFMLEVESTPRAIVRLEGLGKLKTPPISGLEPATFRPVAFFSLWLYSPILGLGRLHETFRFISVSRSRTISRSPWTGDQLVARPLLTVPSDCDDGEIGGLNGFWQGKPKCSEETCPDATLSTTNPTCQTRARTRAAAVGSQRLA
jgi:hypothetical protein